MEGTENISGPTEVAAKIPRFAHESLALGGPDRAAALFAPRSEKSNGSNGEPVERTSNAKAASPRIPLRTLIVEDSENDAVLLEIELQRAGYDTFCQVVETASGMINALDQHKWDVVIADYVMPHFNGLAALALVKERGLDLPFIIVSGHITEATAVGAMKAGAHDYVMKDNLTRLGPAVERELREARMRRERRQSEEHLIIERAFRTAVEKSVPCGIAAVDLEGRQTYVNPAFCAMLGQTEAELIGAKPPFSYWPPERIGAIEEALGSVAPDMPGSGLELRFRRKNGERFDAYVQITPLQDNFGNVTGWVSAVSDITERKRGEVRLAAEHDITRLLANTPSVSEAAPKVVLALLQGLEVDAGALWVLGAGQAELTLSAMESRIASPEFDEFINESRKLSFASGAPLPGQVWKERSPASISDLAAVEGLKRHEVAGRAGFRSALAFPVQVSDGFFGVLEFFTREILRPDPTMTNMMTAIGSEIAQFIKRRRAEEELLRAHAELEQRVQHRTADLKAANAKLQAAITERRRLEHELLEITDKERRRIGLDLHDDLGQKLSGLSLMTKGLELTLAKRQAAEARDAGKVHALVQEAMGHARDLARDLATLDSKKADLPAALTDLAARAKELFRIPCQFRSHKDIPPLDPAVTNQLYKIVQEAVSNAVKHGKARRIGIRLANGTDRLLLTIHNDGLPFPDHKAQFTGMGLRIMNYRANLIGASLEVKAGPKHGTRVTCSYPLQGKE
jgi:PAS domain S-box-containing protein